MEKHILHYHGEAHNSVPCWSTQFITMVKQTIITMVKHTIFTIVTYNHYYDEAHNNYYYEAHTSLPWCSTYFITMLKHILHYHAEAQSLLWWSTYFITMLKHTIITMVKHTVGLIKYQSYKAHQILFPVLAIYITFIKCVNQIFLL